MSPPEKKATLARPVTSREEFEAALRLLHDSYVRKGYMKPHPSGLRLVPHCLVPEARTFILLAGESIVATVSLVPDSDSRLPSDEVFPEQLDRLRSEQRRLCEVGMLADRRDSLSRSVPALLRMMKCVFHQAREDRRDDLIIAVHPRHTGFYSRLLGFELFGPARPYPAVEDTTAVLMRFDLKDLDPRRARNAQIRQLFLSPLSDGQKPSPFVLEDDDVAYLYDQKTHAAQRLSGDWKRRVTRWYPSLQSHPAFRVPASEDAHRHSGRET